MRVSTESSEGRVKGLLALRRQAYWTLHSSTKVNFMPLEIFVALSTASLKPSSGIVSYGLFPKVGSWLSQWDWLLFVQCVRGGVCPRDPSTLKYLLSSQPHGACEIGCRCTRTHGFWSWAETSGFRPEQGPIRRHLPYLIPSPLSTWLLMVLALNTFQKQCWNLLLLFYFSKR